MLQTTKLTNSLRIYYWENDDNKILQSKIFHNFLHDIRAKLETRVPFENGVYFHYM